MGWLGGGGMLATDHDFIALDMMRWVGGGRGGGRELHVDSSR